MSRGTKEIGSTPAEAKTHQVDGIQVYGRKGPDGKLSIVDAIDVDEGKILEIADRLQRRGFGVMRQREARAGKMYFLFKATWAGAGDPPDDPFA
jgi:hypothetical protein